MAASLNDLIQKFKLTTLKPTTTVERTVPVVHDEDKTPPIADRNRNSNLGHSSDREIREIFDPVEDVAIKVKTLANLIKGSDHVVFYTGAGISTSAKIPDFRGPKGVWTMRDRGLSAKCDITMEQAIPTIAHRCIYTLQEKRIMKYLVSQNVDGLHRRSGIRADMMAELHGNCFKEECRLCRSEFLRNFDVTMHRGPLPITKPHETGRICDKCGRCQLNDTIINFGENLPEDALNLAIENSKKSDLAVVLGTSLRVTPASNLPLMARKLVIVNLQETPADSSACLLIRSRTDDVMKGVMDELGIAIM